MTNLERAIALGNAATSFLYASAVLVAHFGSTRVLSDLAGLSSTPWHLTQALLVAAPFGGAVAWWVLLRWWRRPRVGRPELPRSEVAAAAIGASMAAAAATTVLAFVLVDASEIVAEGLAPGVAQRLVSWPLAVLGIAVAGLLASPVAVLWSLPVILVAGPVNALVSLHVVGRAGLRRRLVRSAG